MVVPHHQVAVAKQAGDAQAQLHPVELPVEDDGTVAERTEGDGDRATTDHIVDDLMLGQDREGVEPSVPVELHGDAGLAVGDVPRVVGGDEPGTVDGRDSVANRERADPDEQLVVGDGGAREVGFPVLTHHEEIRG